MTSIYDSMVNERREHTPWARVSPTSFVKDVANNVPDGALPVDHEVVLRCHYRPDVSSRYWWTLEWTGADGARHVVASEYQGLLFWRAAQEELWARERARAREVPEVEVEGD